VIVLFEIGQAQLSFTVITAISAHPLIAVQTRLYVPFVENPVTVVVGFNGDVIEIVPELPAPRLQVPEPVADMVAVPVK
jgi:hypothetical protein